MAGKRKRDDSSSFKDDMLQLLEDKDSADVILHVGKERQEFKAHSIMLRMRCPFFKSLLKPAMAMVESRSGVVQLPEDSPAAFEIFLTYLYTDNMKWNDELTLEVVAELAQLADKYQTPFLKDTIKEKIMAQFKITPANMKTLLKDLPYGPFMSLLGCLKDPKITDMDKVETVSHWLDAKDDNNNNDDEDFPPPLLDDIINPANLPASQLLDVIEPKGLLTKESLLNAYRNLVLKWASCDFRWLFPNSKTENLEITQNGMRIKCNSETPRTLISSAILTDGHHEWAIRIISCAPDLAIGIGQETLQFGMKGDGFSIPIGSKAPTAMRANDIVRMKIDYNAQTMSFSYSGLNKSFVPCRGIQKGQSHRFIVTLTSNTEIQLLSYKISYGNLFP
mmetsp:Transcript_6766/g.10555  ORF Transcript_6766/g.10555 Transcript_6766/m.10555 type:complete len:392 (+) Transcript_6766:159-1334(+)|eukprot:CAMPEP_0184650688 /NCGR_PEP_ID=MMETSP0308-20130426/8265_1 /TAXON_ID=38269 /ORGANISM="Gloeochaete witrockiana, Strain SAG 46.84" /LENGTH=391 /DNA_ID=CAMNT_0027084423 /DNA_START=101 /DNA_END=1276 /DNA_ORIENTATION=+